MNRDLLAELVRRKLIWCYYFEYLAYAYGDSWITGCLLFLLFNPYGMQQKQYSVAALL